jgi:hypothetical protein
MLAALSRSDQAVPHVQAHHRSERVTEGLHLSQFYHVLLSFAFKCFRVVVLWNRVRIWFSCYDTAGYKKFHIWPLNSSGLDKTNQRRGEVTFVATSGRAVHVTTRIIISYCTEKAAYLVRHLVFRLQTCGSCASIE